MNSQMDVQNLFERIKFISEEAAHRISEAVPHHQDILSLTREDLNELLPGGRNFQVRKQIMGLINLFLQEQAGQSMDSVPADVMSDFSPSEPVSYDPDILTSTREDLNKLLPGVCNFQVRSHIMGLIKVFLQEQPRQSMDSIPADVMKAAPYDPDFLTSTTENLNKLLPGDHNVQVQSHIMGLIKVFLQKQTGQSTDSSPDAMSLAPEILQSNGLCTESDKKQQHLTTLDTSKPNNTNNSQLPGKGTDPAGEESESDPRTTVPAADHSSGASGEYKPVILVFIHHCHNPSHMTDITVQPSRGNILQVVHCAFHETKGLLRCQENDQAVADVQAMLMKHK
ncbi:uncharacterized protein LOC125714599 isoform X2 [Brienomyrus brachyistius]|uniref:uncharacterized protein LOC125714599 isoform X2 n=1 Tax=Brienomyrus brachyistius TaxID=42636 RepID=UPI0020B3CC6A|nr:uncharacterized protein LOC125714599 isoform X2 [Brienomyrus brachyistius]